MKSTSIIVCLCLGIGLYVYETKYARFNYEGAIEPGYAYPEKVRSDFLASCDRSFTAGRENAPASTFKISDDAIDALCECCLDRLEDAVSYKEYDQEHASRIAVGFGAGMAAQLPRQIRHLFNACANDLGYEIAGAFF